MKENQEFYNYIKRRVWVLISVLIFSIVMGPTGAKGILILPLSMSVLLLCKIYKIKK